MLTARFLAIGALLIPLNAHADPQVLNMVGTGDGYEMLSSLAVDFNGRQGEVQVAIPPSIGSGGGIAAIGSGTERLARIARELKETEAERGIKTEPIARMPSAIYTHKNVGITGITSAQLVDIFSGNIRNWRAVGGPDLPIKVVRREEADSTLTVLRSSMPGWKDLQITERSKLAMTTQESIESVETVPGAIGIGPFTKELANRVAVMQIDGRHPRDAGYPSAVVLTAAYKNEATPDSRRFLDYLAGEDAKRIMLDFGATPLAEKK